MLFDAKLILKAMTPKIVAKVITAFDRSTLLLSGATWLVMIVTMSLTIYTMHMAIAARRDATKEMVAEPHLPKTIRSNIDAKEIQALIDRLKRLYPGLEFTQTAGKTLTIATNDGSKFREWLTALSYIDSVTPQFHWSLYELCAGKCGGKDLMRAALSGEKISYEAPKLN
ncbi:MAG: hypothetical protein ABTQ34_03130 [Bdellovibrionales bacterium]